jgi:hypothetical protein
MSKKLIIPRESLPIISSTTGGYQIRFRITTEDRNRFSAWSQIFNVISNLLYDFNPSNIDIFRSGNRFTIVWEPVTVRTTENVLSTLQEYDLWVQWSKGEINAEWIYLERVMANTKTIFLPSEYYLVDSVTGARTLIEEEPDRLYVEIYVPANPPIREDVVYEGGE